ncbi:MAG: hypothetical protein FWE57_07375 [Chitinispirillia bacterium]|nr:hypothetical protein [Chitinispirillia bacterium]
MKRPDENVLMKKYCWHKTFAAVMVLISGALAQSKEVTVAMWDMRCDGWDGKAALRINVNGTDLLSNARLAVGCGPAFYTFNVNKGDAVQFYWVNGNKQDYECAFAVYYSENQPSMAFNPSAERWSSANDNQNNIILLYRQYKSSESGSIGNGTLMGGFTVGKDGF